MSIQQTTCGAPELSWDDVLRAITGTDASGNPVVRVVNVTSDSGNYFDCNKQGVDLQPGAYLGLNEEGRVALRVNISNLA